MLIATIAQKYSVIVRNLTVAKVNFQKLHIDHKLHPGEAYCPLYINALYC